MTSIFAYIYIYTGVHLFMNLSCASVLRLPDKAGGYYNLSCPFEWSKYSCAHQGKTKLADSGETFAAAAFGQIKLPSRRVIMIGDSAMRQLFVSVGCSGIGSIEEYKLDWATDYNWPCHGSINCLERGEHSGFNTGSIKWTHGGEMHFLPHAGSMRNTEPDILQRMIHEIGGPQRRISFGKHIKPFAGGQYLDKDDVVIYNAGYHNSYDDHRQHLGVVATLGQQLNQLGTEAPLFAYITTPTQHFPGPNNGGYVKRVMDSTTLDTFLEPGPCSQHASDDIRTDTEHEILSDFYERSRMLLVDSIDVHDLGKLHVGDMEGGKADCTHYCQPGVPDMQAKSLFDQIAEKFDL
eukprot:CAMPEP_0168383320 /NCGR_PEP_ID=MMETSP0228-20121227/13842_1 /TAXON_ID=133427 /ORGANISM="Protoceratium reticulatum, Strain CCCM 535 (=CCMP 1889)" /LENGTH=349 /DNA_ID=CAMNT_0008396467 /DNA_START=123 /DNA_END=1172 /DNA_ORIENTATION=+